MANQRRVQNGGDQWRRMVGGAGLEMRESGPDSSVPTVATAECGRYWDGVRTSPGQYNSGTLRLLLWTDWQVGCLLAIYEYLLPACLHFRIYTPLVVTCRVVDLVVNASLFVIYQHRPVRRSLL